MWSVVIPVKGTSNSKSRFGAGDNSELAIAMALDTVCAALAAEGVDEVIVVTSAAELFERIGATVIADPHAGLSGAIDAGLAAVDTGLEGNRAVLLGDLPALRPAELGAALERALGHPLSIVADSEGTGTTLATATSGYRHVLAFGPGSREAHVASSYTVLEGDWPGLTWDVDTPSHLAALVRDGRLGRHTSAYLQASAPT